MCELVVMRDYRCRPEGAPDLDGSGGEWRAEKVEGGDEGGIREGSGKELVVGVEACGVEFHG